MRSPRPLRSFSIDCSSPVVAARAAQMPSAASAATSRQRRSAVRYCLKWSDISLLLLTRSGLAADRIVVVVRDDLQFRERLIHQGRRLIRRDARAGWVHRNGLRSPALVIIAPEGDVVVQLAELPGALLVDVLILVDAAAPTALAAGCQLDITAPARLRRAIVG